MENADSVSGLSRQDFLKIVDGKQVDLYFLKNKKGAEAVITNFGAKIIALLVPDKNGCLTDVVLGKSNIDDCMNSQEPYFGAVCGRIAGRIAKGFFHLEGEDYHLAINNGPNHLHGGIKGFNAVVWDARQIDSHSLELTYLSADGEEGYPGNLSIKVTYTLADDNTLKISYEATTDRTTILNPTNHSYFNLSGEGDPYVGDTELVINANYYLPTDANAIPLGLPEAVEETPFDFRKPHAIGERIDMEHTQLIFGNGYDHAFILHRKEEGLSLCAKAFSPKTGIEMDVYTTEPGVVLYTGNYLDGSFVAKNGHRYPRRSAFCLETQHFPDSIHNPEYPSTVLKPDKTFRSETVFKFGVKK